MIWFTSDTHFGSERTLKFSRRPFKTVHDMDDTIIENWNEVVSSKDIVYHLGDFGDCASRKELNGEIILIKGNYDEGVATDIFKNVFDDEYLKLPSGEVVFLNHYPSKHDPKLFNLFGHVHKLCMIKKYGLNVGIDCHNLYPINIDTVLFYKNAIEKHYDSEVFE